MPGVEETRFGIDVKWLLSEHSRKAHGGGYHCQQEDGSSHSGPCLGVIDLQGNQRAEGLISGIPPCSFTCHLKLKPALSALPLRSLSLGLEASGMFWRLWVCIDSTRHCFPFDLTPRCTPDGEEHGS